MVVKNYRWMELIVAFTLMRSLAWTRCEQDVGGGEDDPVVDGRWKEGHQSRGQELRLWWESGNLGQSNQDGAGDNVCAMEEDDTEGGQPS